MQTKLLIATAAIVAPFVAAAPAPNTNEDAASTVLKDRKMDPLFEIMAWKEGLDQILQNAVKDKSNGNGKSNNGWSHPIWPYE